MKSLYRKLCQAKLEQFEQTMNKIEQGVSMLLIFQRDLIKFELASSISRFSAHSSSALMSHGCKFHVALAFVSISHVQQTRSRFARK